MFLNDWVSRRCLYTPEEIAVVDAIKGRRISYRDLNRRACAIAR
jgi:acyl-CoA synthetase (AMP-forming)/AMP-acid ligase II